RIECLVKLGVGLLELAQHGPKFFSFDDHVDGQQQSQGGRQRRHEQIQLVPGQRRVNVAGGGKEQRHPGQRQLPEIKGSFLRRDLRRRRWIDRGQRDQQVAREPPRVEI